MAGAGPVTGGSRVPEQRTFSPATGTPGEGPEAAAEFRDGLSPKQESILGNPVGRKAVELLMRAGGTSKDEARQGINMGLVAARGGTDEQATAAGVATQMAQLSKGIDLPDGVATRRDAAHNIATHLVDDSLGTGVKAEVIRMIDGGKENGSTIAFDGYQMRV